MSKKFLKVLICFVSIATFIAGIIYFINQKKTNKNPLEETDDTELNDEHLDAMDALDLSSLKFSRHYVDLRWTCYQT